MMTALDYNATINLFGTLPRNSWVILSIVAFCILVLIALAIAWFQSLPRKWEMSDLAKELGLNFSIDNISTSSKPLPKFRFIYNPHWFSYNIIWGKWRNYSVVIFDYDSRNDHDHCSTTYVFLAPDFRMKPFTMRPETAEDKIADFFGFGDIDFESIDFSENFHVSSQDRRWTYDFFNTKMINFLQKYKVKRLECNGRYLTISPGRKRLSRVKIKARLHLLAKLVELTPSLCE